MVRENIALSSSVLIASEDNLKKVISFTGEEGLNLILMSSQNNLNGYYILILWKNKIYLCVTYSYIRK